MTFQTHALNSRNESELQQFYEIGTSIRNENPKYGLTWNDEKNIAVIFENSNLASHLVLVNDGDAKGRLLAFTDSNYPEQGFIGWYECSENEQVHEALLEDAFSWLKNKGCKTVVGPINGNTWNNYRFNMTADYPIYPGQPYQPMYYPTFWKNSGFEPVLNYVTEVPPKSAMQPMSEAELTAILASYQFKALSLTPEIAAKYFEKLHAFYHLCFANNPLFHPISLKEYQLINDRTAAVLSPPHSFLVLDANDEVAGIFLSFIDYYYLNYKDTPGVPAEYKTHKLVIKTLAVHPDYRNKQLGTLMINYIHNVAYKTGYEQVIHASMYVDNISAKKGKEKFQTEILRTYSLLQKEL